MTAIIGARRLGKIQTKAQAERFLEGLIRFEPHPQRIPYIIREAYFGNRLSLPEVSELSKVMREAEIGMLPEYGPQFTPHDEYEPPFVGCNPVLAGDLNSANELGITYEELVGCANCDGGCDEVGFSIPNPIKAVKKAASGIVRSVKRTPVYDVAKKIVNSPVVNTIQKVVNNPIVSTVMGPVALPVGLGIATAKGGAKGALNYARQELKNPVRGLAIKAVAVVFPPVAPAAVALEATNRILDAAESGNAEEAAKATAQIAATYALGELGDPGAIKALQAFKQAKAMRKNIPKGPLTPEGHPRVSVCGARSEEARGVWLKVHFYMDGPFMMATVYTVTGGDAEVFNLKVDTRPIAAKIAEYHKKLHGEVAVSGTIFENLTAAVKKVGKGKLSGQVFKVSQALAGKAKCKAMTPNMPVSDVALAAFAAARKGVDAVDANKKMKTALATVATNLKKYTAVKSKLSKLPFAKKVEVMKNPTIKAAVLNGIGAKFAAARFVVAGGPEKAKKLRANAIKASANFAALARATKSPNPAVANEAKTMAKVVNIAAKARQKTKNVSENSKGGTAGLVIDARGRLRKGRFSKRTPGKGDLAQVMLTKSGVQTGIFDKVSGASPRYTARLQNRLKKIRALSVINGTEEVGCDPLAVGVSEEPVALVGCIGRAEFIGAVRRGIPVRAPARSAPPKKKPLPTRRTPARPPARRAAPPKKPLPARNVLKPKTPALKAIAKLPIKKRVAVAKKIASRLTPEQRELLRQRIAAKRAAMGLPAAPQTGTPASAPGGGGGGGASFEDSYEDEDEEEEYSSDDLEDIDDDDGEYGDEEDVVEDAYAETEEEYGDFDPDEDLNEDTEDMYED